MIVKSSLFFCFDRNFRTSNDCIPCSRLVDYSNRPFDVYQVAPPWASRRFRRVDVPGNRLRSYPACDVGPWVMLPENKIAIALNFHFIQISTENGVRFLKIIVQKSPCKLIFMLVSGYQHFKVVLKFIFLCFYFQNIYKEETQDIQLCRYIKHWCKQPANNERDFQNSVVSRF
jgi:hypothetical protein